MAGRIVKDDIDALRRQADIVAVVSDYTTLKRSGRSFKGLCPFHTERTPSFTVAPDNGFYHCFGCDASGDVYDFLRNIEGLDFPEAVESLARRTGYTLRYEELSARDRHAIGERSRLVAVTKAAQEQLAAWLYGPEGEVARAYLRERGFGREDAERFGLGWAPNQWEALSKALTATGVRPDELIAVGLAIRSDRGSLRDRFRGRLMFPVHDPSGDVIGFGGRVLPGLDYGENEPPKYLNSPETALYKKTRVLYGIPQARADIVRAEQALVCEGYTDVMALHQAGFANAVATCGTAVGVEHLRMISRYAPRVVLAFDADEAGGKAAERAWEAARELARGSGGAAVEVRVLVLPDGKDPADLVREQGAEGLRSAVAAALPVVRFVVGQRLARADLSSEAGRTAALRDALEVVGLEPDPDLRREWARTEVADRIGVAYDFVVRTAQRMGLAIDAHEGIAVRVPTTPGSPRRTGGPSGDASVTGSDGLHPQLDLARARRERAVLRVALQAPELLPDEWAELTDEDFRHPTGRAVYATIGAAGGPHGGLEPVLAAAPDDELRRVIRGIALEDDADLGALDTPDGAELVPLIAAERVRRLLAERFALEAQTLRERLARLNHQTDPDELRDLQRQLQQLELRRRELTTS